ncbi:FeoB-associated Cys-rich membrane protein [Helicobacter burdigaliensis]
MNNLNETIILGAVLLLCVFYFAIKFLPKRKKGCGCGCECNTNKQKR